jgi:DNA mismatch repair protein MutS2
VDARSIALLEFPLVRERLADLTSFGPSRRLAEALEPTADPVIVERGLDETDQARALLQERSDLGVGGARDIGPAVGRARRGGRLDPLQLLEIATTLEAGARLAAGLGDDRRPLLRSIARDLHPLPHVRSTIERSIDPAGELLDTASPTLGGLRSAVKVAFDRMRRRLDALVGSELAGALQEPIVTLRNGRYVVPVKAEARGRVKGVVHDASGSGQTLFVEPLVVVELGNAWREAQAAVAEEEGRILDELSRLVAASAEELEETLATLARFDLWSAKAQLAATMDGVRAETSASVVDLASARHPGLTSRVVPIDIRVGDGYRALVITGPNTGGKTVALRTTGLLCLMHQAGLHVPAAPGSRLPICSDVLADVGDEQSIAQSLSTFSSHMRAIVRMVDSAGPGTLVLLDELGAGTDPTEGSALAQAILDHLLRAGALVVATTHYAELKAYAHTADQARNASVEFDIETLSPTYRLAIGLPGRSQAFAIAERLGLPVAIVEDARSRLSESQRAFEATLVSIAESESAADAALERATTAEQRAADALRAATAERRRARRERDEIAREARAEADRMIAELRDVLADASRRTEQRTALTPGVVDEAIARAETARDRVRVEDAVADAEPDASGERTWRVGDRARSRSGGWEGRLAAIDRDGRRATLEAGGMRIAVDVAELVPAASATPAAPASPRTSGWGAGGVGLASVRTISNTLDVRGARVDEAIEALDAYLDDALVAGLSKVTIVHGVGTGALRDAVRRHAAGHAAVRTERAGQRGEGGDGATILEL